MSLTITIESRKSRQGYKRNVPVLVLYDVVVSWLEKIGEMRMWVKSEKRAESEKYVKKDEV